MQNAQVNELVKAANSTEYLLWQHVNRIAAGYLALTNAQTAAEARTGLTDMRTAAADCEKDIRTILYRWQAPDALILNVNRAALTKWTLDALSGLYVNMHHYLNRFVHCPAKNMPGKVRELTALYFLVKDLAECALEIKPENYRRELSD